MMLSQLSGTTKLDLFDDRAEIELSAHAAVIKALGKRVVADVIEIGARLAKCKQIIESDGGYAAWLAWLDHEFKWDEKTARNFLNVHAFVEQKSGNFPDVSVSAIYLLAAPSTPESARDAVLDLAANGEHMTHAQVKQMIADAKKETADNYERRIATLTKRYEEQEARLREDLASLP